MIKTEFIILPTQDVTDALEPYLKFFNWTQITVRIDAYNLNYRLSAPTPTADLTEPETEVSGYSMPVNLADLVTETTEPPVEEPKKRRTRKAKEEPAPAPVAVPEIDEQDADDEAAEASSDVLTHDDVRIWVGAYTKKFGIVAAQKNIPTLIGCAIADIPNDQKALGEAIYKISTALSENLSEDWNAQIEKDLETSLFDDVGEPEDEITEQDVRDALMVYAKKYDVDDKMVNTLIDGPDILKKTFGPTVTALRLMPKDPASLKKAYDAIIDATENNWYNRKVQA